MITAQEANNISNSIRYQDIDENLYFVYETICESANRGLSTVYWDALLTLPSIRRLKELGYKIEIFDKKTMISW